MDRYCRFLVTNLKLKISTKPMKFGIRTPSLKRRLSARMSPKRFIRHSLGLKAPRGFGIVTNPKKAIYNKIYNKTSVSIDKLGQASKVYPVNNSIHKKSGISITFILAIISLFTPLALFGIVYFIYKVLKGWDKIIGKTTSQTPIITPREGTELVNGIYVPEPTRSLLWITNEDPSKAESPFTIKVTINISGAGPSFTQEQPNFYAEPSLIWNKLPIEPNDELEQHPMYYPQYARLYPKNRYQYLNWLKDVTQETNLSYVFLYFYGLERHLLIGDFDKAVDEIINLVNHHDKSSFRAYAIRSLVAAAIIKKRPDIINKAPFVLDGIDNASLILRKLSGNSLKAKNIMDLANRVGYSSKYYMRKYKDEFDTELQNILYEKGDILNKFNHHLLHEENESFFANMSIPEDIRTIKMPQLIENDEFQNTIKDCLNMTNEVLKIRRKK